MAKGEAKGEVKTEELEVTGEGGEEDEMKVEEAKTEETPKEPKEPDLTPTPTPAKVQKGKQDKPVSEAPKKPPKKRNGSKDPILIPEPKTKVQKTKDERSGQGDGPKTRKRSAGEAATFARRVQPTSKFGKVKWIALKEVFLAEIKPKLIANSVGYSTKEDLNCHGLSQFKLCFSLQEMSYIICINLNA